VELLALAEEGGQALVLEAVELQDQKTRGVVKAVTRSWQSDMNLAAFAVGGELVVAQARIGHDAARDLLDPLVAAHGLEHRGASRVASLPS
jgi:hypothetical protein